MKLTFIWLTAALLVVVSASGCTSGPVGQQSPGASRVASKPATITLNPVIGQTARRGPYTFRLVSTEVKPPGGEPYDRPQPHHRPGDKLILAARGHRFVVVRIEMQGKGADPLRMYWNAGGPHLLVDGRSYSAPYGGEGGNGFGQFLLSYIFEIPEGARSIVFVLPVRAAGGEVTFRLR